MDATKLHHLVERMRALHAAGDYGGAHALNEAVIAALPGNAEAWRRRARLLQLVDVASTNDGLDAVRDALRHAVTLEPDGGRGLIELGHFTRAVEDDAAQGRAHFRQAREIALEMLIEAMEGEAACMRELGDERSAVRWEGLIAKLSAVFETG